MERFAGSTVEWIRGAATRRQARDLTCAACQAAASNGWCAEHGAVCPFCGSPSRCEHAVILRIGQANGPGAVSRDHRDVTLLLPSPVSGTRRPKWTRRALREEFGSLAPLAACYGERLDLTPDRDRVVLAAAACTMNQAAIVSARVGVTGGTSTRRHLFVADRVRFAKEMAAASERLREGFAVAEARAQKSGRLGACCPECGLPIRRRSEYGPDTCPECGMSCCPFCWAAVGYNDCEHLLGCDSGDGEWLAGPFQREELPRLDVQVMEIFAEGARERLGRLAPLLDAYDEAAERRAEPNRAAFFAVALKVARIRVVRRSWEGGACGLASNSTAYFSREPERAVTAVRGVIEEWRLAVQKLAPFRPAAANS